MNRLRTALTSLTALVAAAGIAYAATATYSIGTSTGPGGILQLFGATSGSVSIQPPAVAGSNTLTLPAGTTDFSATGGTSQVVKQTSTGAALTVARLACADLSDSASGCSSTGGGAGLPSPTYAVGNYYLPITNSAQTGIGFAMTTSRKYCTKWAISTTLTIDTFAITVRTSATGNVQVAYYTDGSWGRPGTLIGTASGNLSTGSATTVTGAPSGGSFQVTAGNIWVCAEADNATAVLEALNGAGLYTAMLGGSATAANITSSNNISNYYTAGTFGTWANFTSGTSWTDEIAGGHTSLVAFHVASIP